MNDKTKLASMTPVEQWIAVLSDPKTWENGGVTIKLTKEKSRDKNHAGLLAHLIVGEAEVVDEEETVE